MNYSEKLKLNLPTDNDELDISKVSDNFGKLDSVLNGNGVIQDMKTNTSMSTSTVIAKIFVNDEENNTAMSCGLIMLVIRNSMLTTNRSVIVGYHTDYDTGELKPLTSTTEVENGHLKLYMARMSKTSLYIIADTPPYIKIDYKVIGANAVQSNEEFEKPTSLDEICNIVL